MTPGQLLDRLLPRWRARLGAGYSPVDVDGFIHRNREALEGLVAQAQLRWRAEDGHLPDSAEEFAAYDPIVVRERERDAGTDKFVIDQLMQQIDADFRNGHREELILTKYGLEYVETRAEAIVLRGYGWDAVPLLLTRPALAVVTKGATVALRDWFGRLAIHPVRRGTLNQLHFDMFKVEAKVQHLRQLDELPHDTKDRLARHAMALWKRARATVHEPRPYP